MWRHRLIGDRCDARGKVSRIAETLATNQPAFWKQVGIRCDAWCSLNLYWSVLNRSFSSFLAVSLFRSPDNENNLQCVPLTLSAPPGWKVNKCLQSDVELVHLSSTHRVFLLRNIYYSLTQWRENKSARCPGRRASRIHFHNVKTKKKCFGFKTLWGSNQTLTFPSRLSKNTTAPPGDGRVENKTHLQPSSSSPLQFVQIKSPELWFDPSLPRINQL